MRLDRRRGPQDRNRLDHIGIERALSEKLDLAKATRFLFKYLDKPVADALALDFRIFNIFEREKKFFGGIDVTKARTESFDEQTANLLGFGVAPQAVVAETANSPLCDGAVDPSRRNRGVDAAAERAEHPAAADPLADLADRGLDEMLHGPVRPGGADAKDEILQTLGAARRMRDFGVKLHTEKAPGGIGEGGDRRIAAVRKHMPSRRKARHLVAVAHPHSRRAALAKAIKQIGIVVDSEIRRTVLAPIRARRLAAESHIDQTHAVADTEQRHRQLK